MKVSKNCLDIIKEFEGFMAKPYICSGGKATIGYGSTFYKDGKKVTMKDKEITVAEAEILLEFQVNKFAEGVLKAVSKPLTQNQFDALVSFCYNVGLGNFRISTMRKLINENPNNPKIADNFMLWTLANGKRLNGLVRRRQAESDLYFNL
jgi:lysozyme